MLIKYFMITRVEKNKQSKKNPKQDATNKTEGQKDIYCCVSSAVLPALFRSKYTKQFLLMLPVGHLPSPSCCFTQCSDLYKSADAIGSHTGVIRPSSARRRLLPTWAHGGWPCGCSRSTAKGLTDNDRDRTVRRPARWPQATFLPVTDAKRRVRR